MLKEPAAAGRQSLPDGDVALRPRAGARGQGPARRRPSKELVELTRGQMKTSRSSLAVLAQPGRVDPRHRAGGAGGRDRRGAQGLRRGHRASRARRAPRGRPRLHRAVASGTIPPRHALGASCSQAGRARRGGDRLLGGPEAQPRTTAGRSSAWPRRSSPGEEGRKRRSSGAVRKAWARADVKLTASRLTGPASGSD